MTSEPLRRVRDFAVRPAAILRGYRSANLRPDLIAGITVAIVAVPQVIAYAAIAGLPPAVGLYTSIVATAVGALWGSSRHLSTGPTNASSILVLAVLAPLAAVGSGEYVLAAGVLAVFAGLLRLGFAAVGLGMVVNFASRAVLLGFTAGAAVLIAVGQLRHLLRIEIPRSPQLVDTLSGLAQGIGGSHLPSVAIGVVTIVVILAVNRLSSKMPGSMLALVAMGSMVAAVGAERLGVAVVGEVPRSWPGFASLPSLGWLASEGRGSALLAGAFAVTALGLVEAISIAREIARQSGDHLDVDQELVGQGLANVAAGLSGGYACSGSFTRSAVNFQAGARTPLAGVFSSLVVLAMVLAFGPLAAFLPQAALAGLILLVAARMVDWNTVRRVARTSPAEAASMAVTFVATLTVPLQFAVFVGVMLSLAIYIYQSSLPQVVEVVPDPTFRHFVEREGAPVCSQLGVVAIRGSLFFGAASHVEDELLRIRRSNPGQHLLLLRMHGVDRCDYSGIEALEAVVRVYRETGGDVFMVQVRDPVLETMRRTGFEELLGLENFLAQEQAIDWLFESAIDPAVCVYECEQRVFAECQPLQKHPYDLRLPTYSHHVAHALQHLGVVELSDALTREGDQAMLLDVREPEEYQAGHLPGAELMPLREVIENAERLPRDRPIFLVCRSGRRSTRAMHWLIDLGFERVYNLRGGILSWKARGRPVEVE